MYCFGDCRSDTFSPRASRSRSRWRIFSRSIATDFMRLSRQSVASSGIASVSTVATAAMAAKIIASSAGVGQVVGDQVDHGVGHQKSKLIILRMTMTPIDIQAAQPASIKRPIGCVHKQLDVLRAGDVDEDHHRDRQAGDDRRPRPWPPSTSPGSWPSSSCGRAAPRERLPSASDRLPPAFCWIAMTMPKKFASGDRDPLVELARRLRRSACRSPASP